MPHPGFWKDKKVKDPAEISKKESPALTKAEIKQAIASKKDKQKRDITNVTLADFLDVPKEIQITNTKIDFDLMGDDLFYQFALKDRFKVGEAFTYQELEKRVHNYFYHEGDLDVPYESWKSVIFKFLVQDPPLIEQFFDETDGHLKLKLTDEAFKA